MSAGTTISLFTVPFAPAWNGKRWTWLSSWISPTFLDGPRTAVIRTRPPETSVGGPGDSLGVWAATAAQTPRTSSRTSTRTAAPAIFRDRRLRLAACGCAELPLAAGRLGLARL